jgi:hypothetical protein
MGATMAISTVAAPTCRMWRIQSISPVKRTPNRAASQLPISAPTMPSRMGQPDRDGLPAGDDQLGSSPMISPAMIAQMIFSIHVSLE